MHIPDGYLSPQTFYPAYAAMIPFWAVALNKVKASLRMRQVPMLALGAAFSFLIMMFNVPFGGTSGHAVGAVLVAILLGPWAGDPEPSGARLDSTPTGAALRKTA